MPRGSLLTAEQARRALYIDFEGLTDEAPVLLGVLQSDHESTFHQVVVSDRVNGRLPSLDRGPLPVQQIEDAVTSILQRARSEDRLIAAWSMHERDVIAAWCSLSSPDREFLDRAYRNCIPTAKAWRSRVHSRVVFERDIHAGRHRLHLYLPLAGYVVPKHLGLEKTGPRLRAVLDQLDRKKGVFDGLTPVVKAKWTKVLQKNMHDCYGLRALMLEATKPCQTSAN